MKKTQVRIWCMGGSVEQQASLPLKRDPGGDSQLPLASAPRSSFSQSARGSESSWKERQFAQSSLRQLISFFEVEDNGPGIPVHLQRRIFDPFVHGDLGLNRKYDGTGLGPSISAQLARIMGGTVILNSEEGKESTFLLKFPLMSVRELPSSPPDSSTPGSRTPSVLSLEEFTNITRTPSNPSLSHKDLAP